MKTEITEGVLPITNIPLSDVEWLIQPMVNDPFFNMRPRLTTPAISLSAELAHLAYRLNWDEWQKAGWTDLHVKVNEKLESVYDNKSASWFSWAKKYFRNQQERLQEHIDKQSLLSDLKNVVRHRKQTNTLKAIIMTKVQEKGKHVIAIGFMGTGKKFSDWVSNMKWTAENQLHKGFYQLTEFFWGDLQTIDFPELAKKMGVEKLTFSDVLNEMQKEDSPYQLWLSGHSQGAAVMQIFCHQLMAEKKVLPAHILGVGFAAPSVAMPDFPLAKDYYPLYHICNSEDVIPRIGAWRHLGLLLYFPSDVLLRSRTYAFASEETAVQLRNLIRPVVAEITDASTFYLYFVALVRVLWEEKGLDSLEMLKDHKWSFDTVDKLINYASDKAQYWTDRLLTHCKEGYVCITGETMDEETLHSTIERFRPVIKNTDTKLFLSTLSEVVHAPHTLMAQSGRSLGVYGYIVQNGLDSLYPATWQRMDYNLPVLCRSVLPFSFATANHRKVMKNKKQYPLYCNRCNVQKRKMQSTKLRV